ncbi:cytochrome P450 [Colletotrichum tofieldiae]|uniref:Cytochrome P450 n=1 Tax=Colletotrichum tofieldiae TaxID=708197 RepID=A0A166P0W6_9PEZI|nr:cytochrome P450 [Colletotrichum tofieldiae]
MVYFKYPAVFVAMKNLAESVDKACLLGDERKVTTTVNLAAPFYYVLRTDTALARLRKEPYDLAKNSSFSDSGMSSVARAERLPHARGRRSGIERIVSEQEVENTGMFVKGSTIVRCSGVRTLMPTVPNSEYLRRARLQGRRTGPTNKRPCIRVRHI